MFGTSRRLSWTLLYSMAIFLDPSFLHGSVGSILVVATIDRLLLVTTPDYLCLTMPIQARTPRCEDDDFVCCLLFSGGLATSWCDTLFFLDVLLIPFRLLSLHMETLNVCTGKWSNRRLLLQVLPRKSEENEQLPKYSACTTTSWINKENRPYVSRQSNSYLFLTTNGYRQYNR